MAGPTCWCRLSSWRRSFLSRDLTGHRRQYTTPRASHPGRLGLSADSSHRPAICCSTRVTSALAQECASCQPWVQALLQDVRLRVSGCQGHEHDLCAVVIGLEARAALHMVNHAAWCLKVQLLSVRDWECAARCQVNLSGLTESSCELAAGSWKLLVNG